MMLKLQKKGAAVGAPAERQFNGIIDVYRKTFASDGIAGLYRGFLVSCIGIVVYRGFYFGLYDTLRPLLLGENAGVTSSFLLGWGVTVTAGLASYPIDTIRRRMMMTSGEAVKYKNSLDCAVQIYKKEGTLSFFRGAGANILRGVAGAGVLAGFDKFQKVYIAYKEGSGGASNPSVVHAGKTDAHAGKTDAHAGKIDAHAGKKDGHPKV